MRTSAATTLLVEHSSGLFSQNADLRLIFGPHWAGFGGDQGVSVHHREMSQTGKSTGVGICALPKANNKNHERQHWKVALYSVAGVETELDRGGGEDASLETSLDRGGSPQYKQVKQSKSNLKGMRQHISLMFWQYRGKSRHPHQAVHDSDRESISNFHDLDNSGQLDRLLICMICMVCTI